jgi:hypothetical protein
LSFNVDCGGIREVYLPLDFHVAGVEVERALAFDSAKALYGLEIFEILTGCLHSGRELGDGSENHAGVPFGWSSGGMSLEVLISHFLFHMERGN